MLFLGSTKIREIGGGNTHFLGSKYPFWGQNGQNLVFKDNDTKKCAVKASLLTGSIIILKCELQ